MEETQEDTMARFLHGLNKDIQDEVVLQSYNSMDELIQWRLKGIWKGC